MTHPNTVVILQLQEQLEEISTGHPHYIPALANLGTAFLTRYMSDSSMEDLQCAIEHLQQARELVKDNDPSLSALLVDLGVGYDFMHQETNALTDLNRYIDLTKGAVKLMSHRHVAWSEAHERLGRGYFLRFPHTRERSDIDLSFQHAQTALSTNRKGHEKQIACLNTICDTSFMRCRITFDLSDVTRCIALHQQLLQITPDNHESRKRRLESLAKLWGSKHALTRDLTDLECAIQSFLEVVDTASADDGNEAFQHLGDLFVQKFQKLGDVQTLDKARIYTQKAVDLAPEQSSERCRYLQRLARIHDHMRSITHQQESAELAALRMSQAIDMLPRGERGRAKLLQILASLHLKLYGLQGSLNDVAFSSQLLAEAESLEQTADQDSNTSVESPWFELGYVQIDVSKLKRDALHIAASSGHVDIVRHYVLEGVSLDRDECGCGLSHPLHDAAARGHLEVIKIFLDHDTDIHMTTRGKGTALHLASGMGHLDIVKLMIASGAEVNQQARYGQTPLHTATQGGQLKVMAALINNGADISALDYMSQTPLHYACLASRSEAVAVLLEQDASNIDVVDHGGSSALSLAARHGNDDIVQMILKYKVDIERQDHLGRSIFWWAQRGGHTKVISTIIDIGTKQGISFVAEDISTAKGWVANEPSGRSCDICTWNIPKSHSFYRCEHCQSGDFDVCQDCADRGAHCLNVEHKLTFREPDGDATDQKVE